MAGTLAASRRSLAEAPRGDGQRHQVDRQEQIRLHSFARESLPPARAASTADWENRMQQRHGLDELRGQGGMAWIEEEKGWVAAAEDVVGALSKDGFDECKREMTR